ncbi:MAG: pilus assembly protein TadG-related protein, partial [Pseudomonadota bacterium]
MIRRFIVENFGNVASIAAIMGPALFGATALAMDYAIIYSKRSQLQQVADAAAIAGATELGIAGNNDTEIDAITKAYVNANFLKNAESESEQNDLTIDVGIETNRRGVTVGLEYYWEPFVAHYLDAEALPISVEATAALVGEASICTLALAPDVSGSILLNENAEILAERCAVQANSTHKSAISVAEGSKITSSAICSG